MYERERDELYNTQAILRMQNALLPSRAYIYKSLLVTQTFHYAMGGLCLWLFPVIQALPREPPYERHVMSVAPHAHGVVCSGDPHGNK